MRALNTIIRVALELYMKKTDFKKNAFYAIHDFVIGPAPIISGVIAPPRLQRCAVLIKIYFKKLHFYAMHNFLLQ